MKPGMLLTLLSSVCVVTVLVTGNNYANINSSNNNNIDKQMLYHETGNVMNRAVNCQCYCRTNAVPCFLKAYQCLSLWRRVYFTSVGVQRGLAFFLASLSINYLRFQRNAQSGTVATGSSNVPPHGWPGGRDNFGEVASIRVMLQVLNVFRWVYLCSV